MRLREAGGAACALLVTAALVGGCSTGPATTTDYAAIEAGLAEKSASLDREVIADGLAVELAKLEDNAAATLAADLGTESVGQLAEFGVDGAELCRHLLSRLEFQIGAVTLEGTHAEVPVTVTNVDLSTALAAANEAMSGPDTQGMVDAYLNGEPVDLLRATASIVYATIDACDTMCTTEVPVLLEKEDGRWSVDDRSGRELVTAILGGFSSAAPDVGVE